MMYAKVYESVFNDTCLLMSKCNFLHTNSYFNIEKNRTPVM